MSDTPANTNTAPSTASQAPANTPLLPITITLDHNEQGALIHILNAFLRATGLEAMGVCGHFINKFEGAQKIAQLTKQMTIPENTTRKNKKKR